MDRNEWEEISRGEVERKKIQLALAMRREKEKMREKERGEEKEGRSASFFLMSTAFRRSEFIGSKIKVRLLDEGYSPRGRDSSYLGLFPP